MEWVIIFAVTIILSLYIGKQQSKKKIKEQLHTKPTTVECENHTREQQKEAFISVQFATPPPYSEGMEVYILRGGKHIRAGETHFAAFSNDLDRMLAAIDIQGGHIIDRHFLLLNIVNICYAKRDDEKFRKIAMSVADIHISEMRSIVNYFIKKEKFVPRITTFQHYATILTENGEYDKAISVCGKAIELDLHDNTISGFEGRIERIKNKRDKALLQHK
jgi:hypothetical protein